MSDNRLQGDKPLRSAAELIATIQELESQIDKIQERFELYKRTSEIEKKNLRQVNAMLVHDVLTPDATQHIALDKMWYSEGDDSNYTLVGYARRSNAHNSLKLSISSSAYADCTPYQTSDGQSYVTLVIPLSSIEKIVAGERSVTAISHLSN